MYMRRLIIHIGKLSNILRYIHQISTLILDVFYSTILNFANVSHEIIYIRRIAALKKNFFL